MIQAGPLLRWTIDALKFQQKSGTAGLVSEQDCAITVSDQSKVGEGRGASPGVAVGQQGQEEGQQAGGREGTPRGNGTRTSSEHTR